MSEADSTGKSVSRRSMLKWAGALGGAVVVGAAAGFGADMLVRPNVVTTKTVTTTTTTTTTPAPPATISYKPPLSAAVQTNVNSMIQSIVARHAGEFTYYAAGTNVYCGSHLKVHVKNGVITAIEGEDVINHNMPMEDKYVAEKAVTNGLVQYRAWGRDIGFTGLLYNPNRVIYPMKRISADRGTLTGKFVRITWQEALDTIASAMAKVQANYGNYSIHNNPVGAWQGCTAAGWGDHSTEGGDFAMRLMYSVPGIIESTEAISVSTALKSKLIVLHGQEATYEQAAGLGGQSGFYLRLAHEKGIPIIAIDPRYTTAAEALADQWIPIRQGTDVPFLLAVANVLFKENLYDTNFVSKFVETTGFAKWMAYVLGTTAGPDGAIDRTPEWAEPICGIPAATIRAFAELYAKSKPTFWSTGCHVINKQPGAHNTARILITLGAMTGNTGVEGGTDGMGWYSTPGCAFGPPAFATSVPAIDIGQTPGTFKLPIVPSLSTYGLYMHSNTADAILLRQKFDSGQITLQQYVNAIGANPNNPLPNIHMAFAIGSIGNWVTNLCGSNKIMKAIKTLDLMVAATDSWMHTACQVADIVLPITPQLSSSGAAPLFEESRFTAFRNVMVYSPRLIARPGEVKPTTWIWLQLAKRLGFGDKYSSKFVNVPDDQWDTTKLQLDQAAYETWAALPATTTALGKTPPSWADFLKKPYIEFPLPTADRTESIVFSAQIQKGTPFATESGKIEVYSKFLANPSADTWKASNFAGGGIPYGWYMNAPISPMGIWEPYWATTWSPAEMNKYPIWLSTPHSAHRFWDFTDLNPLLGDASTVERDPVHSGDVYANNALKISVSDAKARGIQDGDKVRVFNDSGQIVVKAVVSSTMSPGFAQISMGRYTVHNSSTNVDANGNPADVRGNVNTMTYTRPDPTCTFPHTAPVEVEKV